MKKYIIFFLLMMFPFFIYASEIDKISLDASNKAYVNKEIEVTFNINYKGFNKKSNDEYGIIGYTYQIDFDDKIFIPVSIKSDDYFEKTIYKDENNKYHVVSSMNIDNSSKNKCNDNLLYCSNIKDVITFSVKDTSEKTSNIKMFASVTYLYKINSNYEESDKLILDSSLNVQKNINILKNNYKTVKVTNISKSIKSNEIENIVIKKINDYKELTNEKSNNNLSKLEIEGYDIVFDEHLLSYDINVSNDVNSLKITAECENKNAKLEIVGNDNLKLNNNVVEIIVTAENGEVKTYKINAINEEIVIEEKIETSEDIKKFYSDIKDKINTDALKTVGISLLAIIIIIIIIKSLSNNKLDKKFNDFDKL